MELFLGLFVLTLLTMLQLAYSQDFTYKGAMGPEHWSEQFSTCSGKYQSPIDINSHKVVTRYFGKLLYHHFETTPLEGTITNNGHTVVVRYKYKYKSPAMIGGPLYNEHYSLVQYHFHWGQTDSEGSEDRIDHKSYPAELHVVFKNDDYDTFEEAANHSYGILVIATFVAIQKSNNAAFEKLIANLHRITEANSSFNFPAPPALGEIILDTSAFFAYNGSLTTPPCSEDVIWIDYKTPVMMSARQLHHFRRLNSTDGTHLTKNFRPTQPLNNRTIYFQPHSNYDSDGVPLINSGSSPTANPLVRIIFGLIFLKFHA